ncbi:spore coat associated protein CotJA [Dendrosporobacter sp. 1207_IL3150]|uniref:spore coat associated protein CotJA n=1 Tax=Dendrosporobacter sp. 1207_IL3150 TaxID=3084054 RepID=UPI002FD88179
MKKKPMPKWYDEMDDDDMDMMMDDDYEEGAVMQHGMAVLSMPKCIMLAHAYVPNQCYNKAFCPQEALMKGTLFPELWGAYPIPN